MYKAVDMPYLRSKSLGIISAPFLTRTAKDFLEIHKMGFVKGGQDSDAFMLSEM
jgi:hypothetical protein